MTVPSLTIVEGPDLAGKSTLIEREYADCVQLAAGPPRRGNDLLDEYYAPLTKFSGEQRIVCDRWHFGELVYPQILDRQPLGSRRDIWNFTINLTDRFDVHVIFLIPTYGLLQARWYERGDELLNWAQLAHSLALWHRAAGYMEAMMEVMMPARLRVEVR